MKYARALVWASVVVWCTLPVIWLGLTTVSALASSGPPQDSKPSKYSRDFDHSTPSVGVANWIGFGGGGLLMTLGAYGVWCAVGSVCGMGTERALLTLAECLPEKRKLKLNGPIINKEPAFSR